MATQPARPREKPPDFAAGPAGRAGPLTVVSPDATSTAGGPTKRPTEAPTELTDLVSQLLTGIAADQVRDAAGDDHSLLDDAEWVHRQTLRAYQVLREDL